MQELRIVQEARYTRYRQKFLARREMAVAKTLPAKRKQVKQITLEHSKVRNRPPKQPPRGRAPSPTPHETRGATWRPCPDLHCSYVGTHAEAGQTNPPTLGASQAGQAGPPPAPPFHPPTPISRSVLYHHSKLSCKFGSPHDMGSFLDTASLTFDTSRNPYRNRTFTGHLGDTRSNLHGSTFMRSLGSSCKGW